MTHPTSPVRTLPAISTPEQNNAARVCRVGVITRPCLMHKQYASIVAAFEGVGKKRLRTVKALVGENVHHDAIRIARAVLSQERSAPSS